MLGSYLPVLYLAKACKVSNGLLPSLYDGINCPDGATPELTSMHDVIVFIGNIVRILIAVSGSLAVILILLASLYYITSTGDPGRVTKAKEILKNTAIGLVLIIMSYAVVTYVAGNF